MFLFERQELSEYKKDLRYIKDVYYIYNRYNKVNYRSAKAFQNKVMKLTYRKLCILPR